MSTSDELLPVTTCPFLVLCYMLLQGCSCMLLDGDPSSALYLASTSSVWGVLVWGHMVHACCSVPTGVGQQMLVWGDMVMPAVQAGLINIFLLCFCDFVCANCVGQQLLVWRDLVHAYQFCANWCWPANVGLGGYVCANWCWPENVGLGGFGPCLPV
ncbi:hypothetical protein EDD16DRAFT_1524378 [Pisolithus croceorrhizus]|nr:hypothetical protein EV401DRAFT_1896354 [Pisolithus croceorrhizus]KAI6105148.1 hypothetical protein EDD16DRAFT_1524378 [Pisolithus croceorrhizus]KAI6165473.1 hypothetical protein EDD17DRAFT_1505927 [Pisolithus thermaeus]